MRRGKCDELKVLCLQCRRSRREQRLTPWKTALTLVAVTARVVEWLWPQH